MRERPYAFLRLGDRWVDLTMVTDIVDEGDSLTVFLASDMARMVLEAQRRGVTSFVAPQEG